MSRDRFIGGQYQWLARYCAAHDIDGMELAIHRDDKARELLAGLIDGSRVRLDPAYRGDSRYELFRCFRSRCSIPPSAKCARRSVERASMRS